MNIIQLKKGIFILLLCILRLPGILLGQNIELEGRVFDSREPLQYVSIAVKNTGIGTISNGEGKFRLTVPREYRNYVLCISMIGYKTCEVKIQNWQKDIQLERVDFMLPEISIMPEDSMLRFMKKAIDRIGMNYLSSPTRQKGFYRTMLKNDTTYQYFGEALLDVYKPSYRSKESGSIKILHSRITRGEENKSMPPLYFYGGIYLPFSADFVQLREAFLDPVEFKQYNYTLDEILMYDGNIIYKIVFSPKEPNKGKFEGFFHIDKRTLAFLDIQFSYTTFGCEQRSRSVSSFKSKLNCKNGSYVLKYSPIGDRYFLKYILYKEDFQEASSGRIYTKTNEYLTSEINSENTNPIPLHEQDMFSTVFSVKATSVNESTWQDYSVLTKEPLQLAFSEQQARQLLLNNKSKMNGSTHKEKLIQQVMRMQSSIYVNIVPLYNQYKILSFSYRPTNQHTFQIGNQFIPEENQISMGMSLGYNLTNLLNLFLTEEHSFNSNKWESYSMGLSYNIGLKSYGRRFLLSPQVSVNSMKYGIRMGEFSNTLSFKAGNKKISSEKIRLYLGEQDICLQPSVMVKKDISRSLKLFAGADFCWTINSRRLLFIEEASGFLFRKKANIPLNRPEITYSTDQSGRDRNLFNSSFINFKAGIILGR